MTPDEVTNAFSLQSLRNRNWNVVGTSAHANHGLFEGLEWLAQTSAEKK